MRGWSDHQNHLLIISHPKNITTEKSSNGISKPHVQLIWLLNMEFRSNECMSLFEWASAIGSNQLL